MSQEISMDLVKELRNSTGISVMQCRKALIEAEGDMEKAIAILKKNSASIAEKKADREAKDGAVVVATNGNKNIILALHCETDFVAKNEDFVKLMDSLAEIAINESIDNMRARAKDLIDPVIQKTGEKIELGEVLEIDGNIVNSYVHNGKSAVVVSLSAGDKNLAKDIAMHVAAMRPEFINESEISPEAKNMMLELFQKEVENVDKPAEIKEKMLQGKISAYFKEKTLMEQPFIKNPEMTIAKLLASANAQILEIKKYFI